MAGTGLLCTLSYVFILLLVVCLQTGQSSVGIIVENEDLQLDLDSLMVDLPLTSYQKHRVAAMAVHALRRPGFGVEKKYRHSTKQQQQKNGRESKKSKSKAKKSPVTSRGERTASPSPVMDESALSLNPQAINFNEQPVGILRTVIVTIINHSKKSSLHLLSISGTTVDFHASFFQDKVVAVGGNTTFQVLFLPRTYGRVAARLVVQTSNGDYYYEVSGVGVNNPYHVKALVGGRVPLNVTYSPVISLHNPFQSSMQILEMYSSGGNLRLDLPSGQSDAPKQLWEIPPYETKNVMRAAFSSSSASNFTGYIRVRFRQGDHPNLTLVIPVNVEVTNDSGLFSSSEVLDFGTLRAMDEPKNLSISVMNGGQLPVRISNIEPQPPQPAVNIQFSPLTLKSSRRYSKVAYISFSASLCPDAHVSGKLVFTAAAKGKPVAFSLPYQAHILKGALQYTTTRTSFLVAGPPFEPVVHTLPLTNTFNTTIVITAAGFPLELQSIFSILDFNPPVLLPPSATVVPLHIQFKANMSYQTLSTSLRLSTNASAFIIPVQSYSGQIQLKLDSVGTSSLDFGIIGSEESHTKTLRLVNTNPVEVPISMIESSFKQAEIRLVSLLSLKPVAVRRNVLSSQSNQLSIPPEHEMLLNLELKSPLKVGHASSNVTIRTTFDQTITVNFSYQAVPGSLQTVPKELVMEPTFPGRVATLPVRIKNSFKSKMTVLSVRAEKEDSCFKFIRKSGQVVLVGEETEIGNLTFDPLRCGIVRRYLGIGVKGTTAKNIWLHTLTQRPTIPHEQDLKDYEVLREAWASVENGGRGLTRPNRTFLLNTDLVEHYKLNVQASLVWPTISQENPVIFPVTHVSRQSRQQLRIFNPSDTALVVHLVMLYNYPNPQRVLDLFSDRLDTDLLEVDPHDESFDFLNDSAVGPKNSVTLVVSPRQSTNVNLLFRPASEKHYSSLVIIRNNLTVLDAVAVHGLSVSGSLHLNNHAPGEEGAPLTFPMSASTMKQCSADKQVAVQRMFLARNIGPLPLRISEMFINEAECSGYGFSVVHCRPFVLQANSSRHLNISFIPDFSMSRVWRQLRIRTDEGGWMVFNLLGTLPHNLLPKCAALQPRPWWERTLAWVTRIICLTLVLSLVINWTQNSTEPPPNLQPVLDLNKPSVSDYPEEATDLAEDLPQEKVDRGPVVDVFSLMNGSECRKVELLNEKDSPNSLMTTFKVTESVKTSVVAASAEEVALNCSSVRSNAVLPVATAPSGYEAMGDSGLTDSAQVSPTGAVRIQSSTSAASKKGKKKVAKKTSNPQPESVDNSPMAASRLVDEAENTSPVSSLDDTFFIADDVSSTEGDSKGKGGKKTKAMIREEKKLTKKLREKERELAKKPQRFVSPTGSQDALDELIRGSIERDTSMKTKRARAVAVVKPEVSVMNSYSPDTEPSDPLDSAVTMPACHPNEVVVDSILAAAAQQKDTTVTKDRTKSKPARNSLSGGEEQESAQKTDNVVKVRLPPPSNSQASSTRQSRPANLFSPPSTLSPGEAQGKPSPHELASLIASTVGGKPDHEGAPPQASSSPSCQASLETASSKEQEKKSAGQYDNVSEMTRKASKSGTQSSTEVFQRYLNDPTQQPVEFRPMEKSAVHVSSYWQRPSHTPRPSPAHTTSPDAAQTEVTHQPFRSKSQPSGVNPHLPTLKGAAGDPKLTHPGQYSSRDIEALYAPSTPTWSSHATSPTTPAHGTPSYQEHPARPKGRSQHSESPMDSAFLAHLPGEVSFGSSQSLLGQSRNRDAVDLDGPFGGQLRQSTSQSKGRYPSSVMYGGAESGRWEMPSDLSMPPQFRHTRQNPLSPTSPVSADDWHSLKTPGYSSDESSPNWDAPGDPGSLDLFSARTQEFHQQHRTRNEPSHKGFGPIDREVLLSPIGAGVSGKDAWDDAGQRTTPREAKRSKAFDMWGMKPGSSQDTASHLGPSAWSTAVGHKSPSPELSVWDKNLSAIWSREFPAEHSSPDRLRSPVASPDDDDLATILAPIDDRHKTPHDLSPGSPPTNSAVRAYDPFNSGIWEFSPRPAWLRSSSNSRQAKQ